MWGTMKNPAGSAAGQFISRALFWGEYKRSEDRACGVQPERVWTCVTLVVV